MQKLLQLHLGITIRNYALWDRLVNLNIYQLTPLLILIILLLVELHYYIFYKKSTLSFIVGSLATGTAGAGILWVYNRILHSLGSVSYLFVPFWIISSYAFVYPIVLEFIEKRVLKTERLYENPKQSCMR